MGQDIAAELLRIKSHIEKSKVEASRIEGQISQLCQQRSSEFGCATDEEAATYIQELELDVARLDKEIEDGVATVKEELGWG